MPPLQHSSLSLTAVYISMMVAAEEAAAHGNAGEAASIFTNADNYIYRPLSEDSRGARFSLISGLGSALDHARGFQRFSEMGLREMLSSSFLPKGNSVTSPAARIDRALETAEETSWPTSSFSLNGVLYTEAEKTNLSRECKAMMGNRVTASYLLNAFAPANHSYQLKNFEAKKDKADGTISLLGNFEHRDTSLAPKDRLYDFDIGFKPGGRNAPLTAWIWEVNSVVRNRLNKKQGLGRGLVKNFAGLSHRIGAKMLRLEAIDDGRLAWLRLGFDTVDPLDLELLKVGLCRYMRQEGISLTPPLRARILQIKHAFEVAHFEWDDRPMGAEFLLKSPPKETIEGVFPLEAGYPGWKHLIKSS